MGPEVEPGETVPTRRQTHGLPTVVKARGAQTPTARGVAWRGVACTVWMEWRVGDEGGKEEEKGATRTCMPTGQ